MKKYIYISLVILFTVLIFGHIQAATISNTAIKGMSVSVLSNNTFPNISSIACVPGSLSLPEITDNKSSTSTKIVQGALLKWGYKIDDKEIKFGIYGNSTKKQYLSSKRKTK